MSLETIQTFISDPDTKIMMQNSFDMFITLFVELTVLFLGISFLVAIINQKVPPEKIQRLLGAQKGRGYFTAAGLGAITPFCSCSTIPMLIGLLKAKAGFGPVMTFLFTSPLLNPIVIALFIPVLGMKATIMYATLALSVSLLAGVLLQRFGFEKYIKQDMLQPQTTNQPSSTTTCCDTEKTSTCCDSEENKTSCDTAPTESCCEPEPTPCCSKETTKTLSMWANAWQESWSLFRSMAPYMLIAMVIGAIVHGFVPAEFFTQVASADNPAAVPAAALIGIPLYIRVTTLLPLVASFIAKGVSIGAIIALVIGSGGASLPELILLKRLFKWPLLVAFLCVIFSMAVIGGFLFNYILG
ncbi:MAG: permease [Gammaproteobacteria bacterium]|nr:permease [Gammaproteobacteria bacterium]